MTITVFAEKYRLTLKRDSEDGTDIIRGYDGQSHIFEYGEGKLGVLFMPEDPTPRKWSAAKRAFKAVGMEITQNGDCEGVATFDPMNPEQVRVAMKYADIRRRRIISAAQATVLAKGRAIATSKISLEATGAEALLAPRNDDQPLGWAFA